MVKIAVLTDGPLWSEWEAACVAGLRTVPGAEIVLLLSGGRSVKPTAGRAAVPGLGRAAALREVDARSRFPELPFRTLAARAGRLEEPEEAREWDALLDLRRTERGELWLDRPRRGTWKFRYGEEGDPTALDLLCRNMLRGEATVTVCLDRVGTVRHAPARLAQGTFTIRVYSLTNHLNQILGACAEWPAYACRNLLREEAAEGDAGAIAPDPLGAAEARPALEAAATLAEAVAPASGAGAEAGDAAWPTPPSFAKSAWQAARLLGKLAAGKGRRWFAGWFMTEHWNVGISSRPIESFLGGPDWSSVEWLPRRANFLADPFGIERDGRLHLFAEEFDYASGKGIISIVESVEGGGKGKGKGKGKAEKVDGAEASARLPMPISKRMRTRKQQTRITRTALELPFHLSYPYLLEHDGELYCIPESYQAKEIALYRAVRFPDRWEKAAVLVRDFAAVDATIFRHEGKWWLFCADEGAGWNSHLHIWHADELTGPWRPHARNPVKIDVRSARPAGTPFVHGGRLYRPAQDCSRTYGGALVLNRIERLSETEFAETPAATVSPEPGGRYGDGVHTLSAVGGRTLIDAKTEAIDLRVFWLRLRQRWAPRSR